MADDIKMSALGTLATPTTSDRLLVRDVDAADSDASKELVISTLTGVIDHGDLAGLSTGADHSYIDQDVTSGSSPTLDGTNLTGIPAGALPDADDDGATKGVATFTNADFNATGGVVSIEDSGINHNATTNYNSDEHVDHTSVSITAGDGLSGGGTIASSRTLDVDLNELTTEASIASGDFLTMVDVTDNGSGKITFSNLESTIDHGNLASLGTGADHSYIDQDVTSGSAPTFTVDNCTGTLGAFINTPSSAPDADYEVANKKYVDDNAGGASSLDGLTDVTITSVADNDLLAYDTTSSEWINQTPSEAGFATVATSGDHTDLTAGDGSDHTFIDQDVTSGSSPTLDGSNFSSVSADLLKDVSLDATVGSPSDGDILVYRSAGSDWVLETKPAGGSNPALNDITDVTITSVADNEFLAYDSGTGEWINQTATEAGLATVATTGNHTDLTAGDGSDHTFIDQSVISGSSPTFDGTNFTGIPDGALDLDYAEVAGDVYSGAHDFGGATSIEIPNGTGPTVDAAGEIALDTNGDNTTVIQGVLVAYDGTNTVNYFGVAGYPSSDNDVMAYDSASNTVTWQAQTGAGAGAPTDAQYVTLALDGDLSAERVLTAGTGISLADGGANSNATLSTDDGAIVHDNLSGFVGNEHIDHTGVTLTAGNGLSGGGDISSNRSFALDVSALGVEATIAAGDYIVMEDVTDNGSQKITFANLEGSIDHGNLTGLSTGADHSYIDQDVTSGSSPTFTGTNFSGIPASALPDADDDGATKGVATFDNTDFNAVAGVVTIVDAGIDHGSLSGLSTGADHSYIDQDVTSGAGPRFDLPAFNEAVDMTATSSELNTMDGITATTAELNKMDGVTATTAELNIVDGADTTGKVLNSDIKAKVVLSSDQSNIPSSKTKVQFDDKVYDPNGDFDATTDYDYTVPISGKYLITYSCFFKQCSSGEYVKIELDKDLSSLHDNYASFAKNGFNTVTFSGEFNLTTGEVITCHVTPSQSNTVDIGSADYRTYITFRLVGT